MNPFALALKVPPIAKRLAEAFAAALVVALANWGVEEAKERVRLRREAARQTPPPGPAQQAEAASHDTE